MSEHINPRTGGNSFLYWQTIFVQFAGVFKLFFFTSIPCYKYYVKNFISHLTFSCVFVQFFEKLVKILESHNKNLT